jgi:hypothetical protein
VGWTMPEAGRERLSARAVVVGLLFAHFVNWLIMVSVYSLRSSWLVFGHMPAAVMLPFTALALGLNAGLKRLAPRWALSRTDLVVVLSMGLLASVIPEFRLTGYLLSIITAPTYYATPENRWGEDLVPILPKWLIPSDEMNAVTWFYNGLPAGAGIPWQAWVGPIFWWTTFLAALFLATSALAVIFRKQWQEHERLVFPLAQVPLTMVEEGPRGRPWVFTRRGFWIGAALPVAVVLWNLPAWWEPGWPTIPLMNESTYALYFYPNSPSLFIRPNPCVMAFAYFAPLDVLLSIWSMVVLTSVQLGIYNQVGFMAGEIHPFVREPPIGWQAFGALTVLVAAGLWTARRHLRAVVAKALRPRGGINDSAEFMSYRAAVLLLLVGLAYVILWLIKAGMTPGVVAVYVAAYLVIVLGVTKIIAQCGLMLARAPMTAQHFTMFSLGTRSLPDATMGAFALCFAFICDGNPYVMPQVAHADKLTVGLGRHRRAVFWWLAFTALSVFLASVVISLAIGYARGVQNCSPSGLSDSSWVFQTYAKLVPESARVETDRRLLGCFAGGAGVGGLLLVLRARFAWWPLHPAGLALCLSTAIRYSIFPVFMAWLVKLIVLKVGGYQLHRKTVPVMVGIVAGYVIGVGIGLVVDVLWFPGRGHSIHGW